MAIKYVNLFKNHDGGYHYTVGYESGKSRYFTEKQNLPDTVVRFIFADTTTAETRCTETGTHTRYI